MNARGFEITVDPARRLITVSIAGDFWNVAKADEFSAEIGEAVASLRCTPGAHRTLVDLRSAVLQSRDVFEKMQALIGSSAAERIALVASSPLARMQTKRLKIRDNVVMFDDMPEALAWLLGASREVA